MPSFDISGGSDGKETVCSVGDSSLGRYMGKEMATHSSILAWTIPWAEEPCGLQSMGRKESDTTETTEHTHALLYSPISRN